MIDYTKLTKEEFEQHAQALYSEQDRRAKLVSIPEEVKRLSNSFEDIGGDKAELVAKVNEAREEPEIENT